MVLNRCPKNNADCPHPVAETLEELEFVRRRKMVDWLGPKQLAQTGVKAAIASAFGSYADKRELQAALAPLDGVDDDYASEPMPFWVDYTADLGDGFDATYTIARLLADDLDVDGQRLERGRFVILGGDQVYPTAARDEYRDRFIGPYRAALPYADRPDHPRMYALPGNHDWYDGLTSFLRIFCQSKVTAGSGGRWIGGWQTRQRRSYFALALPDNWWVWAIDSQLESDMDQPQLQYFEAIEAEMLRREPDRAKHKIILATAEPGWVFCPGAETAKTCRRHSLAFNTIAHFERRYIRARGFTLKLVMSGDLHHYVRYEADRESPMRVTAGGGGAFLLGTETMPKTIVVPEETERCYTKAASFPDEHESHVLARDIWKLPFRNRWFGVFLGTVYLLMTWLLQTGSRDPRSLNTLLGDLQAPPRSVNAMFFTAFVSSPLSVALAVLLIGGFYKFTASQAAGHRAIAKPLGLLHGIAHVFLACSLMRVAVAVEGLFGLVPGRVGFTFVLIPLLFFSGWLFGGWLFAAYLWTSARLTGVHHGELFSSMSIAGYKNFLRMRIDRDGLTVFVIGMRHVPDDWEFTPPGAECRKPWFTSKKFGRGEWRAEVVDRFEV